MQQRQAAVFLRRKGGASLLSYGLIVGLIAVAALAAISDIGEAVSDLFGQVGTAMEIATTPEGSENPENENEEEPEETPDTFSFLDTISIPANNEGESEIIQISGLTGSVSVSVSGVGSPAFRICADASCDTVISGYSSGSGSISDGQYLQLRATAGADKCGVGTTTVSVGGGMADWDLISKCLTVRGTEVDSTALSSAFNLVVNGNRAYVVASGTHRVTSVDISDPDTPEVINSLNPANMGTPRGIANIGDMVFVTADSGNSLTAVDFSGSSPALAGQYQDDIDLDGAFGLDVQGDYAYVSSRQSDGKKFVVLDISSLPTITKEAVVDIGSVNSFDLVVSGSFAYVSNQASNSIYVFDISDPTDPFLDETISLDGVSGPLWGARGVAADGTLLLAGGQNSQQIASIDLTNPAARTHLDTSSHSLFGSISKLAISGDFALASMSSNQTLAMIDLSVPESLRLMDTAPTGGFGLAISGGFAYVTSTSNNSLTIVELP